MGFSRQEYWSGLSFPSPGDLPDPGMEPRCPALQADSVSTELQGKPLKDAGWLRCPGRGASSKQGSDISLCLSKDKTCWKNGSLLRWPWTPAESEEAKQLRKEREQDVGRQVFIQIGFPCGSAGKESACNVEDLGWVPGSGRCPGEGKGNPLQYSGLENSMDCIVHGVAEPDTTKQLSLSLGLGSGY